MEKIKRNVPEALLREHIKDLSLEEVTTSPEFNRLLEASLNALLRSHNRSRTTRVVIRYAPLDSVTAFTDDHSCYINTGNPMFTEIPGSEEMVSVKEGCKRVYGGGMHEDGHILYTCFSELERMYKIFTRGELEDDKETEAYNELKDVMKNDKAVVLQGFNAIPVRDFIAQLYLRLSNCVEDGRIENLLLTRDSRFLGLVDGLKSLREYHQSVGETWDMSGQDIPTFMNLCLLYAKYKSVGKYTGGFQAFEDAKPIIEEMVETHEAKKFSQLNQRLLLCAWPMIKDLIMEVPPQGEGQGEGNESNEGNEGDDEKNSKGLSCENSDSKQSDNSSGTGKTSKEQKSLEEKLKEVLDKISETIPEEESNQNDGDETSEKQDVGESQPPTEGSSLSPSIDEIMKEIADEKAREAVATESCEKAKGKVMAGRGFAPYNGTKIINPQCLPVVDIDKATESAVKKAAREIQRHLETDMRTGSSKRKFYGKKFHANKVVNRDFRYFENKATHKDMPKVKVGLVVDESGSMSSGHRYRVARAAAMTLYRIFEYVPNLDIAIYGHSTRHEVEIFNYADFGIKSKNVPGKLMNISARGGNIDIVPISVMAENLLAQDADSRIMFIVTDGLPYSYVRDITPEEELTEVANKYSRKGIEIIVASIGDDEDRLRNIYRNQRFLNISSSSELPKKVVDVIKRKL